ncbi:hypothetical protein [Oribacterium sp. NK2B42]|uniref:hypothetical protein n=1 Tax=Oribacterium sp. NK2B42 TaxID=689781 RepID=UPI00040BA81D|nr:hypothetical protein [Oribacterium sp. NK2B42]
MLKRPFSKFEKSFLLLLVILMLGLVYYRFVKIPVEDRIAAADTFEIEQQIETEYRKRQLIQSMKDEVSTNQDTITGVVATYDNFKSEAALLNSIFVPLAEKYNYSFQTPIATDDTVRRTINISFSTANYRVCRDILQRLHDSKYRCMISNITISATDKSSNTNKTLLTSPINCNLSVTFYETLIGAATTAGLDMGKSNTSGDYVGLRNADLSGIHRNTLETMAESIADEHRLKY